MFAQDPQETRATVFSILNPDAAELYDTPNWRLELLEPFSTALQVLYAARIDGLAPRGSDWPFYIQTLRLLGVRIYGGQDADGRSRYWLKDDALRLRQSKKLRDGPQKLS